MNSMVAVPSSTTVISFVRLSGRSTCTSREKGSPRTTRPAARRAGVSSAAVRSSEPREERASHQRTVMPSSIASSVIRRS